MNLQVQGREMCKILLPIKPKYVKKIFDGKKKFELRRSIPKRKVDEIVIYETFPKSKIVGKMVIKQTHKMKISDLWEKTKNNNYVSQEEFYKYFDGKEFGYAFEIKWYKKYNKERNKERYKINYFPQNFVYID